MEIEGDMSGPRYELFSMLANAAIHAIGIALIPRLLIDEELQRGVLIQVANHEYISDRSYHLIYPELKSDNPSLGVFRAWIANQARQYREPIGLG
jgi:LysR family glycine cleavage system transcriptional activator